MHIQFKLCWTVCKIHELALKALKLNLKRKQQYKHPRSHPNTDRHTHTQFSHCYSTKSFVYMKSLTLGPFSHNTDKINYFMFLKNTTETTADILVRGSVSSWWNFCRHASLIRRRGKTTPFVRIVIVRITVGGFRFYRILKQIKSRKFCLLLFQGLFPPFYSSVLEPYFDLGFR